MTDCQTILFSVADHVAQLTLNRPERLNALNQAALDEINRAMDQAKAHAEVRAFMDIARERGMREAIAWRHARFAKAEG